MVPRFKYGTITLSHYGEVMDFAYKHFYPNAFLPSTFGIHKKRRGFLDENWYRAIDSGMSLMAQEEEANNIVSITINTVVTPETDAVDKKRKSKVIDEDVIRFNDLHSYCYPNNLFQQLNVSSYLYGITSSTNPAYSGAGVQLQLHRQLLERGRDEGFKYQTGLNTVKKVQKPALMMGYEELCVYKLESYEYNGEQPFAGVSQDKDTIYFNCGLIETLYSAYMKYLGSLKK